LKLISIYPVLLYLRENEKIYGFYEAEKTLTNLIMEKIMSNDREDVNIG